MKKSAALLVSSLLAFIFCSVVKSAQKYPHTSETQSNIKIVSDIPATDIYLIFEQRLKALGREPTSADIIEIFIDVLSDAVSSNAGSFSDELRQEYKKMLIFKLSSALVKQYYQQLAPTPAQQQSLLDTCEMFDQLVEEFLANIDKIREKIDKELENTATKY